MNLQWERYKKTHPGTNAPPGTTWRVDGGDKINQTLQEKGCESSSGSEQAVTRVNIEQASKKAMRTLSPLEIGRRLASQPSFLGFSCFTPVSTFDVLLGVTMR